MEVSQKCVALPVVPYGRYSVITIILILLNAVNLFYYYVDRKVF